MSEVEVLEVFVLRDECEMGGLTYVYFNQPILKNGGYRQERAISYSPFSKHSADTKLLKCILDSVFIKYRGIVVNAEVWGDAIWFRRLPGKDFEEFAQVVHEAARDAGYEPVESVDIHFPIPDSWLYPTTIVVH